MPDPVRCVALDAMGVLYEHTGIADRLTRFARARGSQATLDGARALYRRASSGEMASASLWAALGVPGDHDAEFLTDRTLMPGARAFLDSAHAGGLAVGAITNDVAEWSRWARQAQGVAGDLDPWVVSGEVGVRKPARAIYDVFLSACRCAPDACVFVDDQVSNLDAAAALGFRCAWFAREPAATPVPHQRVDSFAALHALLADAGAFGSTQLGSPQKG